MLRFGLVFFAMGNQKAIFLIFGNFSISVLPIIDGERTSGGAAFLFLRMPSEERDAPCTKAAVHWP
ncbi:MAG: hypothetical protein EBR09_02075 [Proteobacteria bacterium]|nr:hypothetical protein [Pseudomonadota bacterium]